MKQENEFVKQFKMRTKKLAIETLKLCDELPYNKNSTRIIGQQLGLSVSSVAANYRSACFARSDKEFYSKLSISIEEGDETCFWLEMLIDGNFFSSKVDTEKLLDEAEQVTRIMSKSRQTIKKRITSNKP